MNYVFNCFHNKLPQIYKLKSHNCIILWFWSEKSNTRLTGLGSVSSELCFFSEALGNIHFLAHSSYKQNSVLCFHRTEVSIYLRAISWELLQDSRCCQHSMANGPFLHLQSFSGGLGLSHVLNLSCLLFHRNSLSDFCLPLLTYKDLLLKAHILYLWVIWILEFNLPIFLRSVTLILSGKILLPCNITQLQVPGIKAWTSYLPPGYLTLKNTLNYCIGLWLYSTKLALSLCWGEGGHEEN